jgi:hypothetical protein
MATCGLCGKETGSDEVKDHPECRSAWAARTSTRSAGEGGSVVVDQLRTHARLLADMGAVLQVFFIIAGLLPGLLAMLAAGNSEALEGFGFGGFFAMIFGGIFGAVIGSAAKKLCRVIGYYALYKTDREPMA